MNSKEWMNKKKACKLHAFLFVDGYILMVMSARAMYMTVLQFIG
jgi:hypothetical protein